MIIGATSVNITNTDIVVTMLNISPKALRNGTLCMSDYILFPDGTWCYESELSTTKRVPNQPNYIKIVNPFVEKVDHNKPQPTEKMNRFYVVSWDPQRGIDWRRSFNTVAGTLEFRADRAVTTQSVIPLIKHENFSFYDVLVTGFKRDGDYVTYTGIPDTWYQLDKS